MDIIAIVFVAFFPAAMGAIRLFKASTQLDRLIKIDDPSKQKIQIVLIKK